MNLSEDSHKLGSEETDSEREGCMQRCPWERGLRRQGWDRGGGHRAAAAPAPDGPTGALKPGCAQMEGNGLDLVSASEGLRLLRGTCDLEPVRSLQPKAVTSEAGLCEQQRS